MTIADVDRAIARLSPHARELQNFVRSIIDPFCTINKYPTLSRIKTETSLIQKIETGRYSRLFDIDDIVGFTIIIPTGSHEQKCLDFLHTNFKVAEVRDRVRSTTNPRQFNFDSTRAYCQLRPPAWEEDTEKVSYKIKFEVQIQTALEHAWVVATHDVVYKAENLNWQKTRLAAQVKAQVEVIDLIFRNFEDIAKSAEDREWKEGRQVSALTAWVDQLKEEGSVPTEKVPSDKIRFAENFLKILSKQSLEDLEESLDKIKLSLVELSKDGFPRSPTLMQIFMIAAIRCGCAVEPRGNFTPHITESLLKFFPELKTWKKKFEYDEF